MQERHVSDAMDYTGERMVPEAADPSTFWEHIHRYRFAKKFVLGRRVLDVACGEGYGTYALLKAGASQVTGVDISAEACRHAVAKYGINAIVGDAISLPLPDASFETVVSFETIEHLEEPGKFFDECLRVLVPGGKLIISTPNRDVYSEHGSHNPFHLAEMNEAEFVTLLGQRFPNYDLYSQCLLSASRWSLRSLASTKSPWFEAKGYFRMRKWLHPRHPECMSREFQESNRKYPEKAILSSDGIGASLFDPYLVRPRSSRSCEKFTYLIAVADKPVN